MKAIVAEVYFPPRATAVAKLLAEVGIMPGSVLDLITADVAGQLWDFNDKGMRDRARRELAQDKPMLLVGFPMCTALSA